MTLFILTPHINRIRILSLKRQTNFKMPVTTRSATAEANTMMRLRSGKILHSVYNDNKKEEPNVHKLSIVEEAKNQVRQRVKARQREIAERHIEKAVNNAIHILNSYVVAFTEVSHYVGVDHVMEKIRIVGMMFAYANSLPIHTMTHERLRNVLSMMLKMCVKFSKEAKEQIDIRIKTGMEIMPERNPKRYYTAQLDDMQGQLDKFTSTYANRL